MEGLAVTRIDPTQYGRIRLSLDIRHENYRRRVLKIISFLAAGLIALSSMTVHSAPAADARGDADLRVHLLGTGSPLPQTFRFGPSTLIEAGGHKYLFDAGRGVIQRLYSLDIPFNDVDKLFLTHLHSDHTIGVPDLYLTGWVRGRKHPLRVWGPEGTSRMMTLLAQAFDYDIKVRLDQNPGSQVVATDVKPGVVYEADGAKITAFAVDHPPLKSSFGYKFEYGGRTVVLSGDTRVNDEVIKNAKGADLLIHEVAAASDHLMKTSPIIPKILAKHTLPEEAGSVFTKAGVRMAVYSHIVLFDVSEEELEARTRKTYDGPLVIGEDLMTFDIGDEITVSKTAPTE